MCVGGRTLLQWEGKRPKWLPKEKEGYYSKIDYGDRDFIMEKIHYIVGANFAVRKIIFKEVGLFYEGISRIGKKFISGGEIEFMERIREKNYRICYSASALVYHRVHSERFSLKFYLKRNCWAGITSIVVDYKIKKIRAICAKDTLYYFKIFFINIILSIKEFLNLKIVNAFNYIGEASKYFGKGFYLFALYIKLICKKYKKLF